MPRGLTESVGRSFRPPRAALLALLVAGLGGFLLVAVSYDHNLLATVDDHVAEWVAGSLPGWAESLARPFSWLGGWIGLTVLGVAVGVVLARERAWLDLAFFASALLGSQLVAALLKDVFDRPRPAVGSAVPLPGSSAFPSAHATAGAASLGAVAVLAAERLPSRRARAWLWGVTVALGLAVGLSRLALNVHYVSDVVAGWCLGIAWLSACLLVRERLRTSAPEV